MGCEFIRNRDIILFALKSWDMEIGGSSKKYASVFAKNNNRVLFVNRALDRASLLKNHKDEKTRNRMEARKDPSKKFFQAEENIWVLNPTSILESINSISWAPAYDFLNRINGKRLAKEINDCASQLGFKDIILYVENDFLRGYYLKELLHDISYTVYYIRDYLPSQDYFKKHGTRLEPKMIQKSDLVITNSERLAEYARTYNANSLFVGQGVDLELFADQEYEVPKELDRLSHPVIGYVGAILSTRLNAEIIRHMATQRPNWNIVMVGPEDKFFSASDLHSLQNVHFTGRKNLQDLPAFISHFDVCINPQLVNEMTIGNYPLKADEYLAMGKPVVATRTDAMKMFEEYVYLCDTPDQYVERIERALAEGKDESLQSRRKAFAQSHTWESCVEKLDEALSKTKIVNQKLELAS